MKRLNEKEKQILEEFEKEEAEARRIRESTADWTFISQHPTPIKEALEVFCQVW